MNMNSGKWGLEVGEFVIYKMYILINISINISIKSSSLRVSSVVVDMLISNDFLIQDLL